MQDSVKYLAAGAFMFALVADGGSRVANAHPPSAPAKLVTADSDPSRWLGGVVTLGVDLNAELALGPFYFTDSRGIENPVQFYLVGANQVCDLSTPDLVPLWWAHDFPNPLAGTTPGLHPAQGARYFVQANQKLCVRSFGNARAVWAGFRPYE
jgi:hypothetical protein